jgi:transglutaminase-like putative cysteine protease
MLFEIDHLTRYRYSLPVQLGEHLLRFLPPANAGQRPGLCEVRTDPAPAGLDRFVDTWGNHVQRVWFQGEYEALEIHAHLEVETLDRGSGASPGDFALSPDYGADTAWLGPYRAPLEDPVALEGFVQPLLATAAGSGLDFLQLLNRAVHGFYHRGVRLDGPPLRPAQTLAAGAGVCRDLSVLFMAACRQVGLAARFVSGYQQGDGTRQVRYLHAWPEVYLPGGGWFGLDPTHGTPVGPDHVAVAAAPAAAAVTPVEGGYSFRGAQLDSTLETEILITAR